MPAVWEMMASSKIVQRGLDTRETIEGQALTTSLAGASRKLLIMTALLGWLAALDDFRNWLQLGLRARERA